MQSRVLFRWSDSSTLLVGSSAEFNFDSDVKSDEFHGIHVEYLSYPNRTDSFADPKKQVVVTKPLEFEVQFKPRDDVGTYGDSCTLQITAKDGTTFDQVAVKFYTRTGPKIGPFEGVRIIPAGGDVVFGRVELDGLNPLPLNVSAVALDDFSAESYMTRSDRAAPTASGGGRHEEKQVEWKISSRDFSRLLEELNAGVFELKIGLFLDNYEFVYSNAKPLGPNILHDFQKCLVDNGVFPATP